MYVRICENICRRHTLHLPPPPHERQRTPPASSLTPPPSVTYYVVASLPPMSWAVSFESASYVGTQRDLSPPPSWKPPRFVTAHFFFDQKIQGRLETSRWCYLPGASIFVAHFSLNMKAPLVFTINVILSVTATATSADECNNICVDVKKSVGFKAGCSEFRNSLPRPKVL